MKEAFGSLGTVRTRPGREIEPADVRGVDVLLVRSVTSVGPALLEGSGVQFVGSATIGTDHVDRAYLEKEGIAFAHAPGANAPSVADYVVVALLALARQKTTRLTDRTVGVIGCGNIGGRLAQRLSAMGMRVLCNDPPLAAAAEANGSPHSFVDLDTILSEVDVLTLHVPLTKAGSHPTHHLIDADVLRRLKEGTWVINTSRGSVVDGEALRHAITRGPVEAAVLDVWEKEPTPRPDLIEAVDLATPHIAGYAYEGKVRATAMLYEAFCNHADIEPRWNPETTMETPARGERCCRPADPRLPETDWLYVVARQGYDLRGDDAQLRELLDCPPGEFGAAFSRLRTGYRRRHELQQYTIRRTAVPSAYIRSVKDGLTIQLD